MRVFSGLASKVRFRARDLEIRVYRVSNLAGLSREGLMLRSSFGLGFRV